MEYGCGLIPPPPVGSPDMPDVPVFGFCGDIYEVPGLDWYCIGTCCGWLGFIVAD